MVGNTKHCITIKGRPNEENRKQGLSSVLETELYSRRKLLNCIIDLEAYS